MCKWSLLLCRLVFKITLLVFGLALFPCDFHPWGRVLTWKTPQDSFQELIKTESEQSQKYCHTESCPRGCDETLSPFCFLASIWMDSWSFWCGLWREGVSHLFCSLYLLRSSSQVPYHDVLISKKASPKGLRSQVLSCCKALCLREENWDVIYLSEDVINCVFGKMHWGLFYLIPPFVLFRVDYF